jgi:CubicO group peptidase (beta-lactamase class C family)
MALAAGVVVVVIAGLLIFVMTTATPIHPAPEKVPSVTGSPPPARWTAAVEKARQIVRAGVSEQNLPGVSVAVGAGGEIVWAEGFGYADLENRVRVEPATRFRIGTASAALTSAAVGLLLDQGRLKLDDEIQTYVPAFPRKQWPVTLRQLMGHLAGVGNDAGDEEPLSIRCDKTIDGLKRFAERPLLFEPGTRYRYSSYGWVLLSAAVEAVADEPFFTFMRRQVFEPLGMEGTRGAAAPESIPNRANYYFPQLAGDPRYGPQEHREVNLSCLSGSSAFLSTASDLVRFALAIDGGKLLQPATVQSLQASQRLPSGEETGYGLGWDLETAELLGRPTRVIGHDGDVMGGMLASFMTFPEHGIVVAVTSNTAYADTFSLAVKIAEPFVTLRRASLRSDRRATPGAPADSRTTVLSPPRP